MFVSVLASVAFSVAGGFLTVLVMMESPVRGLLTNRTNPDIREKDIRLVQKAIHLVASVNAPIVPAASLIIGTLCTAIQTWQHSFEMLSLLTAILSVVVVLLDLKLLGGIVKIAVQTNPEGDITHIRQVLRREVLFHHCGFCSTLLLLLAQLVVVLS